MSMLRNYAPSKLCNHKLLTLKLKFNMLSEQGLTVTLTNINNFDRFDQVNLL